MNLLLYVTPLIFSTVFGLVLAIHIARISNAPGSRPLMVLVLAATLWSAGYAMEFVSPDLQSKLFWAKFEYFGIVVIPVAWFVFTRRYQNADQISPRWWWNRPLLALIPAAMLALVWSNDFHRLVWRDIQLRGMGTVQILEIHHGPGFWVFWLFAYALMLLGSFALVKAILSSMRIFSWQIGLALFAIVVPWISNLTYVTRLSPIDHLDWTPFGFLIAGLFLTISLFRYQLVNILPIAQQQVFDGQADRLFVLDSQNRVVDLNPAAKQMCKEANGPVLGKPFNEVCPNLGVYLAQAPVDEELHTEIKQEIGASQHFFDLVISPLSGNGNQPVGKLVSLHDITLLKQQQAHLEQAVAERTEELKRSIEQLRFELVQRTLAEKRLQEVIESAPDAMLLVDPGGAIREINAQAERLFGYTRQEILGQPIDRLMPHNRRGRHYGYASDYFADPTIRHISRGDTPTARRKDGSLFPAEISLGPLDTADGVWATCNVRDISARVQAQAEQQRLVEEIQQSREQLRALALRLQEVQEIERRQIAGELHDRIGQNLTGLNLNLQLIETQLGADCSGALSSRLTDSQRLVEETTRQVRDVMADLHPPVLDDYGLVPTLQWYSGIFSQRTGIPCKVTGSKLHPRPPSTTEIILFRLIQEALNNVAKHARATQVEIRVESNEKHASITVQDNGNGFSVPAGDALPTEPHWGLSSMRQRAGTIGAELQIDSYPGQGTRVCITFRRDLDDD